jgi:VanZ family protein
LTPVRAGTFYWLPVVLYCAALFIQSSFPAPEVLPDVPGADKLLHAGAYALLGWLFARAWNTTRLRLRPVALMATSFACALAYGVTDELHQAMMPFRSAEILDVAADGVGAAAGVWGWRLLSPMGPARSPVPSRPQ